MLYMLNLTSFKLYLKQVLKSYLSKLIDPEIGSEFSLTLKKISIACHIFNKFLIENMFT